MNVSSLLNYPHRRKNILIGEWILVSPQRTERPWLGELEKQSEEIRKSYDPDCYLCPGNRRANNLINPNFTGTYVFENDFPALLKNIPLKKNLSLSNELLKIKGERGICKVVVFSPRHDLTLAEMTESEIEEVIETWKKEYKELSSLSFIKYIQIFENKGSMMGCSNPHPHCQIWAQESIPAEVMKERKQFKAYQNRKEKSLLSDYLELELHLNERVVYENNSFVIVVPFWAIWPYETLLMTKRRVPNILELSESECEDFADALKVVTVKYDNLFKTSFPYSAGIHQIPINDKDWHFHMHFYPPLLISATIKKFMVGYEMLAEPQRDITPEYAAEILRNLSNKHFRYDTTSNHDC